MAVVTGALQSVANYTGGTGPSLFSTISGDEWQTAGCFVTATFPAGTYAAADNAQVDVRTRLRELLAKPDLELVSAAFVSAGQEDAAIVGAKTVAVSGANVTCELTQEDLTTEHPNGAMNANWPRPITFWVTYRVN